MSDTTDILTYAASNGGEQVAGLAGVQDFIAPSLDCSATTGLVLLSHISSYWESLFADRSLLESHLDGVASEYLQLCQDLAEAIASVSVEKVPVFHKENWTPLRFKESEVISIDEYFVQYADESTRIYGDGLTYGHKALTSQVALPLPDALKTVSSIHDRILDPRVSWVNGTDYTVTPTVILLNSDPFNNSNITAREIVDSQGLTTDKEIILWGNSGYYDWNHLWSHFGYILGISGPSSLIYKIALNVFWKSRTDGFSAEMLHAILSATTGIPLVISNSEVVQAVDTEPTTGQQRVTTDKRVYTFSTAATVSVQAGQILPAGASMTDGLLVSELGGVGSIPSYLTFLTLDPDWFSADLAAALSFQNNDLPLTYIGKDADGITEVQFPVSGSSADVAAFWTFVHAAGKASGKTLANALDLRDLPTSEPDQNQLPVTVNPAKLIVDNFLKSNLFLVRLKLSQVMEKPEELRFLGNIREMLPPGVTFLFQIDISVSDNSYQIPALVSNSASEVTMPAGIISSYDAAAGISEFTAVKQVVQNT